MAAPNKYSPQKKKMMQLVHIGKNKLGWMMAYIARCCIK